MPALELCELYNREQRVDAFLRRAMDAGRGAGVLRASRLLLLINARWDEAMSSQVSPYRD